MNNNLDEAGILVLLLRHKELIPEIDTNIFEDTKLVKIYHTMKDQLDVGNPITTKDLSILLGAELH